MMGWVYDKCSSVNDLTIIMHFFNYQHNNQVISTCEGKIFLIVATQK